VTTELRPEQLAQWVSGTSSIPGARRNAESCLRLEIAFVHRASPLTDSQRSKLELAGVGDIERFFVRFEQVASHIQTGRVSPEDFLTARDQLRPLAARYETGLHGRGSLFQKTIRTTLVPEQVAQFDEANAVRVHAHYRRIIHETLAVRCDPPLGLDQRMRLVELLLSRTEHPDACGEGPYNHNFVLLALSQLPEDEIQPFFDDEQWKVMKPVIESGHKYADWWRNAREDSIELDELPIKR
jgi:hypothetical protein